MKFGSMLAVAALLASSLSAQDVAIPVAFGKSGDRLFATTVEITNRSTADINCLFLYASPEQPRREVESTAVMPAGKTLVFEDLVPFVGSPGVVRVRCSEEVRIIARIQDSLDEGKSYRDGRLYEPIPLDKRVGAGGRATIIANADVVLAEVAGETARVEALVANKDGVLLASKEYVLPPFGHRVVNLAPVWTKVEEAVVEIRVTSGNGEVAIGRESRDRELASLVRRRDHGHDGRASQPHAASARATVPQDLLLCSFKGAPFRDPATRLCYFRERWYDTSTGTFLTADPMRYQDSSDVYAFGGGDPVNKSDPTGSAASVSRSGVVIGIRPDGTRYTIERGTDPVEALRILESDADLRTASQQEDILRRANIGIPYSSAPRPGEQLISSSANHRRYTHEVSGGAAGYVQGFFMSAGNLLTGAGGALSPDGAYVGFQPSTREQVVGAGATEVAATVMGTRAAVKQVFRAPATPASTGPRNNAVGGAFDDYVAATRLRGLDEAGRLARQERLPTPDLVPRKIYVKPDYSLYNSRGQVAAYADAKTGEIIPFDAQAQGLILWAQTSTSRTLIYYTPDGMASISSNLVRYAQQHGVKVLQVPVR